MPPTDHAAAPADISALSSGEGDSPSNDDALSRADMERALRFAHLVDMQTKARVAELSATVGALVELLVGGGQIPLEAYEKRKRLTLVRENERAEGEAAVRIADVPDKYAMRDLPQIDCASLLPICKARCCGLPFALSVQDLDERAVRWDYGAPYTIARGADGYCVHNGPDGACSVYERRPGMCRAYDCRRDRRIWLDFDRRIPAE